MIRRLNIKQPEPIRYFSSDFLERFTHTKLWHVWVVWFPVFIASASLSFYLSGKAGVPLVKMLFITAVVLFAGIIFWTLIEYLLHRFIFHYYGENSFRKKLSWYAHGTHHAQAQLKTRLVMPLIVSISIGLLFGVMDWLVFGVLLNIGWVGCAFFAGLVLGYMFYDTMHWCMHFFDMDWKWYKVLRRNHMRHHTFYTKRFGVSNTVWDKIFKTHPTTEEEKESLKTHAK